MIILPERDAPRGRVLLPMRRSEWQKPSEKIGLYTERDRRLWVLTARAHDGAVIWRGRFEDREDADAFLWAIATGSLRYERKLWRLPIPIWPGLPDGLIYEFVTYDVLSNTAVTTYNVPADFNSSSNTVHAIGGGGSGGAVRFNAGSNRAASGGSGAAYAAKINVSMTPNGTKSYQIGTGGAAHIFSANNNQAGNNGADTTLDTTVVVAKAGLGGTTATAGADANGPAGGSPHLRPAMLKMTAVAVGMLPATDTARQAVAALAVLLRQDHKARTMRPLTVAAMAVLVLVELVASLVLAARPRLRTEETERTSPVPE